MENMPTTLEKKLKDYELSLDYQGYSAEELRNNVTGYVSKKPIQFSINGKLTPKRPNEDIYFYFNKDEDTTDIPIGHSVGYLPLSLDKYGFENESTKINPEKAELNLNESSELKYQELLSKKGASLKEILETAGSVINSSMKYDFDKIKKMEEKTGHVSDWTNAQKIYAPTGEEINSGICSDSGRQVRDLLKKLNFGEQYKIVEVSSSKNGFLHDTTLVFNKETGSWGVINSKSPTKDFNFATKEQLSLLGHPYMKS